jgi:hypothetical protein
MVEKYGLLIIQLMVKIEGQRSLLVSLYINYLFQIM